MTDGSVRERQTSKTQLIGACAWHVGISINDRLGQLAMPLQARPEQIKQKFLVIFGRFWGPLRPNATIAPTMFVPHQLECGDKAAKT
jgi:hypothetical protein